MQNVPWQCKSSSRHKPSIPLFLFFTWQWCELRHSKWFKFFFFGWLQGLVPVGTCASEDLPGRICGGSDSMCCTLPWSFRLFYCWILWTLRLCTFRKVVRGTLGTNLGPGWLSVTDRLPSLCEANVPRDPAKAGAGIPHRHHVRSSWSSHFKLLIIGSFFLSSILSNWRWVQRE